jgi:hypothetical protein
MKKWLLTGFGLVVVLGVALTISAQAQQSGGMQAQQISQSDMSMANKFWKLLSGQSYRFTYHHMPGKPMGFYKGTPPHGKWLQTYVNNIAYDAIVAKVGKMPGNSIIAKDNYMTKSDSSPAAVTAMVKVPGYDPAHGNWFYAKYGPNGKVDMAGKVKYCMSCHEKVADNDYIYSTPIK